MIIISAFVSIKIVAVIAEKKLQHSVRHAWLLYHAQFNAAVTTMSQSKCAANFWKTLVSRNMVSDRMTKMIR